MHGSLILCDAFAALLESCMVLLVGLLTWSIKLTGFQMFKLPGIPGIYPTWS